MGYNYSYYKKNNNDFSEISEDYKDELEELEESEEFDDELDDLDDEAEYEDYDSEDDEGLYDDYTEDEEDEYGFSEAEDLDEELDGFAEAEIEEQFKKGKNVKREHKDFPFLTKEEFDIYIANNESAIKFIKTCDHLTDGQREWLMDDFVARNMNLVYYIANKKIQSKFMIDVKELISAGMLGFTKALAKYDPEQGAKFATFAFRCIDNEIKYGIRVESKHYNNTESINKPRCFDKDGKPMGLEETIADTKKTPEESASDNFRDSLVREKLNALSPLEKYVMYTRFGLDRGVEMTQKEVAAAVQMSQANISKIEKTCLEKLQTIMKDIDE